jgi:hypothetical protein
MVQVLHRCRCFPGRLPTISKRCDAIEFPPPDHEVSGPKRRGLGPISVLLASCRAGGAQTSSPVQPVSMPDSIKPPGTLGPAALDKAANTLYATRMRGIDPKTDKLAGGTYTYRPRIGAETMMRLAAPPQTPHPHSASSRGRTI